MKIWGENNELHMLKDGMLLRVMPWGKNSLRVMMYPRYREDLREWALTEEVEQCVPDIRIETCELKAPWEKEGVQAERGMIRNGRIQAQINEEGWISFQEEGGKVLLREYWRDRRRLFWNSIRQ